MKSESETISPPNHAPLLFLFCNEPELSYETQGCITQFRTSILSCAQRFFVNVNHPDTIETNQVEENSPGFGIWICLRGYSVVVKLFPNCHKLASSVANSLMTNASDHTKCGGRIKTGISTACSIHADRV